MSKSGPEKLKMKSQDMALENVETIARTFPNVVTEIRDENGEVRKGIDFDLLKQELSGNVCEGREERYEFTWVGKKQSIVEGNLPIQKTLRPCMDESKDWERTKNIYIEGDNLEALKLLQESYLNKIKMIYIDPPYNTGNDFVYNDSFDMSDEEYDSGSGALDDSGNRLIKNPKDSDKYHSAWCSMLFPRLKLAHNILREDGVILISIDDNEVQNLRKMMDEIFGEENFIDCVIWKKRYGGGAKERHLVSVHEYILFYAKNIEDVGEIFVPTSKETIERYYKEKDSNFSKRGPYRTHPLEATKSMEDRKNLNFPIPAPDGTKIWPKRQWLWGPERVELALKGNELAFLKDKDGKWSVHTKQYLKNEDGTVRKSKAFSLIDTIFSQHGTNEIIDIFKDARIFPFPKPTGLLKPLIDIGLNGDTNGIVLDFFSGSCSTAHAIMQLNLEDNGYRNFIMVQLPEPCDEKSDAFKAGYKTISEIGKERLRRVGEKLKNEKNGANRQITLEGKRKSPLDIGFRVFKIDDTNMKDVYYSAAEYSQETIEGLVDNVRPDRTDLDLLYQIVIDWGLPLDLPHEIAEIDGFHIHIVDNNALVACFDANIPESVMRKIALKKPLRAVFRDGSFKSSPGKLNIEGIFKTIAPDTTLRVI